MKRVTCRFVFFFAAMLGLSVLTPGAAVARAPVAGSIYVVKRMDSLAAIAQRHQTSVAVLMRANHLKTARALRAGQRLTIAAAPKAAVAAPAGLPAGVPARGKAIYVSISQQRMTVYSNGKAVYKWLVSTGLKNGTKAGAFRVQSKYPEAWASTWSLRMPYWIGIYYVGRIENGIHALPINKRGVKLWSGLLGRPASFGCVILGTQNAQTLYRWAPMGTPVIIQR
jgi:lipoprotein-anchoring transpeptidase ErfK/SrfK